MKRCPHPSWSVHISRCAWDDPNGVMMQWCSICGSMREARKLSREGGVTYWEHTTPRWNKPNPNRKRPIDKPF